MGNAVEKTPVGGPSSEAETSSGSYSVRGHSSSSSTRAFLDVEAAPSLREESEKVTYRRYYPKSRHSHYPPHQHAPSSSSSVDIFRNSCSVFEHASPLRKRLRATATVSNVEEILSSPAVQTPPNHSSPNSHSGIFVAMSTRGPWSTLTAGGPVQNSDVGHLSNCDLVSDDDDKRADSLRKAYSRGCDSTAVQEGPIMKAVLSRGLRAKFKSFSAWLLSEPGKASFPHSGSLPSGFGDSLKRWSSLRSSSSFQTTSTKLQQKSSSNTLSKKTRPVEAVVQSNAGSLNSLSDGRTPWPVPWLEAIFLPEFPSRGAVNEKTFSIVGTIAKGAFGKVYRVSLKASPEKIFAMKVQSKSDVITQNAIQQIKDEVSIHQMFADYPFIAQLYCTWQSRSKLYIVLQYIAGYGDLYQLWRDEGPFSEDAVKIWGAELAMALDYMHARGVIYRDIKMENIMLDDDGHLQLVDFGLAKWLYYGDRTSTICGTLQYMAPEVLQGDPYNHAADWWSLGVLLHTLMCGSYPYSGADSHTAVKIDDYVPPPHLSLEAQMLLSKLLRKDPTWRLRSFTVYKTQSFFSDISFDSIRKKMIHPFDYIPRMRRCNTCNVVNEDLEGLEDSDLAMFQEDYDGLKNFDSFYGDEKL